MNNIQFVAFDVETASTKKPRFICQIGIAVVDNNNKIIESKSIYVKPPENIIDPKLSLVHGITSDKTISAKEFPEVWEDIKVLFQHKLVAHNINFDLSVLRENLEHHNITSSYSSLHECTFQIYNRRLDELCCGFGIEASKHHDAGFDAECCAQFYINHKKGVYPDIPSMDALPAKDRNGLFFGKETKLKGDILKKDLSNADPNNPFYDKKIVITGTFVRDRKELAEKLKRMGVDINTTISKETNIVLMGNKPGPAKVNKIKSLQDRGIPIRIIEESELESILSIY